MVKLETIEKEHSNGALSYRSIYYVKDGEQIQHGYYESYYFDGDVQERVYARHGVDIGFSIRNKDFTWWML